MSLKSTAKVNVGMVTTVAAGMALFGAIVYGVKKFGGSTGRKVAAVAEGK